MSEMIQGFKIQCHINSIDFNSRCSHFATGGRDHIRIFDFNLQKECWFENKKNLGRYKGTSITKACVSQLAWNKEGREALAIGTTSGLVSVYDAQSPYKNLMLVKGHEGNIKNIEWNPGSKDRFISASFQNQIIEWDVREQNKVAKYEFTQNTKIRDVKFNPSRPYLLAVQSSNKLQLLDLRKGMDIISTYEILSNQMQGIGVQWDPDPNHPYRIASAISKKICVFDVSSNIFQFQESLSHYSLIKSFYWMTTKPTFFGIMGEHPEKNLFFYDLEDKNRIAYMYGGHSRSIDCWRMTTNETILLSVSNQKQKAKSGVSATATQYAILVAQHTQNYFDPNQSKFNYPLTFSNDSDIAFCLNMQSHSVRKSSLDLLKKKSSQSYQSAPTVYQFKDSTQWFERDNYIQFPMSLKEEIIYLDKNYKIQQNKQESNEKIAQHNSEIASRIGKVHCAEVWKNLFQISFPPEEEELTLEAIYERKMKLNISIVDNTRVILTDTKQKFKSPHKIQISSILQWLIDQHNELQTAALATVCLLSRSPQLLTEQFVYRVFTPYIELLRGLELFEIAAKTILITKSKRYTMITESDTKYSVQCGSCKNYVSKGDCTCNLLCVICQGRLSEGLVIWCKYCGHGGHARDYEKWFKIDKKKYCPHGCGHTCFTDEEQ